MEKLSVAGIYEIARSFEQLRSTANFLERFGKVNFVDNKMESIELLPTRSRLELGSDWRRSILSILSSVEKYCEDIGLELAAQAARDYAKDIETGKIKSHGDASEAIGALDKIIVLQLRRNLFMFIPAERAEFFDKPELFGPEVNRRFPSCQQDIQEAGNCYAAGRNTACGFHLMRIMESGVQEFGTALGITLTSDKQWQNILNETNKAIKALPPSDTRTILLSQVAGHLYNVKVAWRNPTMHPKIAYAPQEARDLLLTVKAFMFELSRVI